MIDGLMPKVDDYGTDDLLMITGFKLKTGVDTDYSGHR